MSTPAETIRQFYTVVDDPSKGNDELAAFFSESFVDHNRSADAPAEAPDRLVALGLFEQLAQGFPDAKHDLEILEDIGSNRAMVYWTYTGTHTGPFFDSPASGNEIKINGVDIFRVEDGLFVEQWHVEELATLFGSIATDV
jgi:predicted ester cyclase